MSEQELRKIVTNILEVLEKSGYLKEATTDVVVSKRQAYVLCEVNKKKEFLEFLRENKLSGDIQVTAIMEDNNDEVIDALVQEQLCHTIAGIDAQADKNITLSIYPTMKRSALCEAGLGMDNEFTAMWIRKDMEMGRKSVILVGGMEPFTGMEPAFYRELILSYVKNLMRMDVKFVESIKNIEDL